MSKLSKTLILASLALSSTALADVTGTVDAKPSKFLKDTIVYVKSVPGTKLTAKTFEVDQQGMAFSPHQVLLAVGDTVKFHNHDKVDHNVMSPEGKYDLGNWGTGGTKEQVFKTEGVFSQICKIHPEMLAYVFVGQNRFAAQVDDKGAYKIAGLPAGTYSLEIWNPKLKAAAQTIKVGADGNATANFSIAR
jgi:plastocyanin